MRLSHCSVHSTSTHAVHGIKPACTRGANITHTDCRHASLSLHDVMLTMLLNFDAQGKLAGNRNHVHMEEQIEPLDSTPAGETP